MEKHKDRVLRSWIELSLRAPGMQHHNLTTYTNHFPIGPRTPGFSPLPVTSAPYELLLTAIHEFTIRPMAVFSMMRPFGKLAKMFGPLADAIDAPSGKNSVPLNTVFLRTHEQVWCSSEHRVPLNT